MEEKKLVIEVEYIQGKPEWERRVVRVFLNGQEVPHHQAVSELLKTSQPPIGKQSK
jgi:hypothetical protein